MTLRKRIAELEARVTELESNTLVRYKCMVSAKNKEIKMLKERLEKYEPGI